MLTIYSAECYYRSHDVSAARKKSLAQKADRHLCRLFQYGLTTGGPGVMSVGWIVISFFSMLNTFLPECENDELISSSIICWARNG